MKSKFVSWLGVVIALLILLALPATGSHAQGGKHRGFGLDSGLSETPNLTATGVTQRVSINSNGDQGEQDSMRPSISGDGRYIAFWSEASNLVEGDTNDTRDIFVHDRETGQTKRVSVASDGSQANAGSGSYLTSISSDGNYVAFSSLASNLVPEDTNAKEDVFIHNLQTGQTEIVSISSDATQGNYQSYWPSLSADGQYVAFTSSATNLVSGDTNERDDIFIHDRLTSQTERVSVASDGTPGNSTSWMPSISGDGRYVAFASFSTNLVPDDAWEQDIFVHDMQTGQTERVSIASDGTQADNYSAHPSISANGQFVAFQSEASNLVNGDDNEYMDIFIHDRDTGITTIVSVASDGKQGDGTSITPSISADGQFVTFSSMASNLIIGDTNKSHIFLHDRQTTHTELISISNEQIQGDHGSGAPTISSDGRYVAFDSSSSNLVCGDTNGQADIFVRDRSGELELSSISGRVTMVDDTPMPDVTITDSEGHVTTTDSDGKYFFEEMVPCKYTFTPSRDRYVFSPPSTEIIVPPPATNIDFVGEIAPIYLPCITRNHCGQSIFDDFSDPGSGWPVKESENVLYEYNNGEYRILLKKADMWAAASPDFQAKNFTVKVDVRKNGSIYGTYGIIFGLAEDWSHFYTFEIDPEGYFGIWRYSELNGWELLTVGFSPHLNQNTGLNKLKVTRAGSLIEVYANNHLLTSLTDNAFTSLGYIGLIASTFNQSNLDVRFDNFSVTPNECVGTTLLSSSISLESGSTNPRILFQEQQRIMR